MNETECYCWILLNEEMAPKLQTISSVSFNPALSFGVRFPNCKTEDVENYEN
jgi:hypothetical protein